MKRWGRVAVAVAMAMPLVSTSNVAADGEPVAGFGADGLVIDSSFTGGRPLSLIDLFPMPDGSFVVSLALDGAPVLARYTADGQLDPSFGSGGVVHPGAFILSMAPLSDGRILAPGLQLPDLRPAAIARDGTLTPGPQLLNALSLIPRPDGAVFVLGGAYDTATGFGVVRVVRPDGLFDTTFVSELRSVLAPDFRLGGAPTGSSYPPNATLLHDGRLVVAFSYYSPTAGQRCGLVALEGDGHPDPTFGINGLASTTAVGCIVDHLADDSLRVRGMPGDPVLGFTSDGTPFGALTAPFDRPDLRSEGTGYSYTREGANTIVALDPLGNIDTTFGVNGLATVPGINMRTFKLLNSGDIIALGTSETDSSTLALARIAGSFGTALQPPAVDTTKFVPVPPKRILDTRDGTGAPSAKLGVGAQIDLQIAGVAGVPGADVSAVVLNVTATEATQAGFVSVYPSGTRRPTVSNLNLETPGQTAANLVTVKVGANGKVSLFTSGGTHLVADVAGYYTPAVTSTAGRLQTAAPQRILDTREGLGAPKAKPGAGTQIDLQVTGRGPVPAAGVSAVILNITGDQADIEGFVTAWPSGTDRPVVSNLNLITGETRANLVIVPVGSDGRVSLFTSGGTDLIADVAGWFTDATAADDSVGLFVPITPTRMLDTRQESTPPTAPVSSFTRLIGATTVVPPASTTAIAANVTVTQSTGTGFVTAWPAHTARPLVSNLNTTRAGQTIPNAVVVPLGLDEVSLYTQSGAHLIIDVNGWYTNF